MKKILIALLALAAFVLSACGGASQVITEDSSSSSGWMPPTTFEQSFHRWTTDVVIVQYVGSRYFATNLTEFEFIVVDRILGNAADRIFVYVEDERAFMLGTLSTDGTEYLLALASEEWPYSTMHIDGFLLIRNIVIELDNPSNSIMHRTPAFIPPEGLDLGASGLTRQDIISYFEEITRAVSLNEDRLIRSERIDDIILESPYVLVVEIGRPSILSHELFTVETGGHDIYYVTVERVLAGGSTVAVGDEIEVLFHANTVSTGERHVVAARMSSTGRYVFTSRNSLFHVNQLDKILFFLEPWYEDDGIDDDGDMWEPEPIPTADIDFLIHSYNLHEIVNVSPYIVAVEINERARLPGMDVMLNNMVTEFYSATVTHSIKGGFNIGQEIEIFFLARTVQPGGEHIVTLNRLDGERWYVVSSPGSVIPMVRLSDILDILGEESWEYDDYTGGGGGWDEPIPDPDPYP